MYCPRCGSQNTDTIRFCRQCGLALVEVNGYVTSGGTSSLLPHPNLPPETFTLKQKKVLAILVSIFGPIGLATFLTSLGANEDSIPLFMLAIPFLITISVMYFNNRIRYQQQMQNVAQPLPPISQQAYVPPHPQAWLQAPAMPVNAVPMSDVPRTAPNTNPLAQPLSVTEDETKRLPN